MTHTQPFKVGVTLHSFTSDYISFRLSFEDMLEIAGRLGGGVEIVGPSHHRGFPEVSDEFERTFKSGVERYGLTPTAYGSYADPFMLPDRNLTADELFEYTVPQLKGAAKLGFPVVRLQYFAAVAAERLIPLAEKLNLQLGYELHAPLMIEAPETQELLAQITRLGSDRLGLIPDTSIFSRSVSQHHIDRARESGIPEEWIQRALGLWGERKYNEEQAVAILSAEGADRKMQSVLGSFWGTCGFSEPAALADIAPHIVHFHGKFYSIVNGDEPDLRYAEVVKTLLDIGYTGWLSSEYEGGPTDTFAVVQAHQAMVKRYISEHQGS